MILVFVIPVRGYGFSDEFKNYMTSFQTRIMLRGTALTEKDLRDSWKKFDEEIVPLLSRNETSPIRASFSIVEKQGTEIEPIELGSAEVKFLNLRDGSKPVWLAILINDMGSTVATTFHVFLKNGDQFERTLVLEEAKGPWSSEKLAHATIQIQKMKEGKFSSFHMMPGQNRSQIVWDNLQPALWCPEVDYHMVGPNKVTGRGPCEGI